MTSLTRLSLAACVAVLLAAPSGAGAWSYRVGPLVPVSGGSPHRDGCNGAGSHATGAEGEPSLAVNPRNPANIVVGFKQDVDNPDSSADGVAVSRDAGRSWRQGSLPASGACNGGESQYPYVTDPWVAFGRGNVVWFATLPYTTANPGAIAVHRSTDGGRSFGGPVYVDRDLNSSDFDDKETIAADPRDSTRVYVAWVKQQRTLPPLGVTLGATVYVARTSDGGHTWSAPHGLATVGTGRALAGPTVVVAPNRDVLVAYPLIVPDNPADCVTDEDCAGAVTVYAVRSTDRGNTWSAPVIAARYRRAPFRDPEGDEFKASAENFSLTLDGHGVAYLAAHDERHAPHSHIVVRRSRDGGKTWQGLTNADKGSRAHGFKGQPIIAAGRHELGVLYFDFRDDARKGDGKAQFSYWFARSRNGGRNWHEQRLTQPSDLHSAPEASAGHFIGDYFGLQAVGRNFLAAVTVARPLARNGPTDIAFLRIDARGRR
jgi:hypothetical protein